MAFKVVNNINHIGAIKIFTKPNCNLCLINSLKSSKIYVKIRHTYEKEIRYIQGLTEQYKFPSIFIKHW